MHKVLIVDDVESDADLQFLNLLRAGIACEAHWVPTSEDLTRQLELFAPDVIICSVFRPQFNGHTVLAIAQNLCPDTPIIFVFETVGEEVAVQKLRSVPSDNVFKTSRTELPETSVVPSRRPGNVRKGKPRN